MLIKDAHKITGGLSKPSKMPGFCYNLPAWECKVGSLLRAIKNSVCAGCYAMSGRYLWPNTKKAMERRLKSITGPLWVSAMALLINSKAKWGHTYFRWHDSGDLQNGAHLQRIIDVCNLTPGVKHWLPTREYVMVKKYAGEYPANLVVRLSAHMIDGTPPAFGFPTSTVISNHTPGPGICPAPEQGGECKACRNCWNPQVQNVAYRAH